MHRTSYITKFTVAKANEFGYLQDETTKNFKVINGYPMNPWGRTGFCGRGAFFNWGVNHAVDVLVTRWRRGPSGVMIYRAGKPVLEFLARINQNPKGHYAFGLMQFPGSLVKTTHAAALKEKILPDIVEEILGGAKFTSTYDENRVKVSVARELEPLFSLKDCELGGQGKFLILREESGFVRDERNTDNAWLETTYYHSHDGTGNDLGRMRLSRKISEKPFSNPSEKTKTGFKLRWAMVHAGMNIFHSHRVVMQKRALELKAYWQ